MWSLMLNFVSVCGSSVDPRQAQRPAVLFGHEIYYFDCRAPLCFDSRAVINILRVISACSQIPHVMLGLAI